MKNLDSSLFTLNSLGHYQIFIGTTIYYNKKIIFLFGNKYVFSYFVDPQGEIPFLVLNTLRFEWTNKHTHTCIKGTGALRIWGFGALLKGYLSSALKGTWYLSCYQHIFDWWRFMIDVSAHLERVSVLIGPQYSARPATTSVCSKKDGTDCEVSGASS